MPAALVPRKAPEFHARSSFGEISPTRERENRGQGFGRRSNSLGVFELRRPAIPPARGDGSAVECGIWLRKHEFLSILQPTR